MLNNKVFIFNYFKENTYILWDETLEGVIVDPGCNTAEEMQRFESFLEENKIIPKMILLTHPHFDHSYGVKRLSDKYGLKIYMNNADKEHFKVYAEYAIPFGLEVPDMSFTNEAVEDGTKLHFGKTEIEVIATPGHSPGSVCYYFADDKLLVTGDTLFAGCIGRTDIVCGDYDKIIVSIMDKLMGLDSDVAVFPGHGPSSSIGYERTHNPFLQPFNEPEEEQ